MASNNKPGPINGPFDEAFLQTLMGRLHLQPPSNPHLSQSLQDLLEGFNSSSDDDEEELDELDPNPGNSKTHLAKEETKLERELIRIVHGGDAVETLKPNSGQSVSVIGHSICVANHEEAGSGYRVWEWHGHLMIYDDEEGFSPEYVYGNYFERLPEKVEVRRGGNSGLRDLIGGGGSDRGGAGDRIVHRGTMNSGLRRTI